MNLSYYLPRRKDFTTITRTQFCDFRTLKYLLFVIIGQLNIC